MTKAHTKNLCHIYTPGCLAVLSRAAYWTWLSRLNPPGFEDDTAIPFGPTSSTKPENTTVPRSGGLLAGLDVCENVLLKAFMAERVSPPKSGMGNDLQRSEDPFFVKDSTEPLSKDELPGGFFPSDSEACSFFCAPLSCATSCNCPSEGLFFFVSNASESEIRPRALLILEICSDKRVFWLAQRDDAIGAGQSALWNLA
ncbi:MAG: hypothetical protein LQ345_000918 [Seirophora villosa]|nr:MAG: hypothetical protein LQ345_000918 [Seirophora villosa]